MLLGVDVGGTFTDAALLGEEGEIFTAKAATTPDDQAEGVIAAVDAALEAAGAEPEAVTGFAHGMTVGTNALLEERGARTALIATEGFTDLLDIARQDRPSLYRLCEGRARPLVPTELRFPAPERAGPGGIVRELSASGLTDLVERVAEAEPESVAICLLFAYADPEHERRIAAALRERLDSVHVSASHEVLPRFREYERCSTTVIDAYLSPLLGRYLTRLGSTAGKRGLPEPRIMRSSGGLAPAAEAARSGAWSVLSGPAGGAVGAGLIARRAGAVRAIGLDMGGTSCDVCVIEDGSVRRTDSREIGGRVIQLPMVDVHTVGAGGGSIAWADAGGALRVGPRSAGAEPGPAAYGTGGTEPTVTDANLVLGYLPTGGGLAGGIELDADAARAAIAGLAEVLSLEPIACAEGIVRVANQEMVRALRVVTVERGVDPREYALLAFGGSGPLHAAALADELEIGRLLCPRAGGVLSALGLLASERRRDTARTVMLRGEAFSAARVAAAVAELRATIEGDLERPEVEATYALRYAGQSHEIEVEGALEPDPGGLVEAFAAEHEARYGYRDPDGEVELVDVRLALSEPGPDPEPRAGTGPGPERSSRRARFGGEWVEAAVVRGEPAEGTRERGPCVLELPQSTMVLPPGWEAVVDRHGTISATRTEGPA